MALAIHSESNGEQQPPPLAVQETDAGGGLIQISNGLEAALGAGADPRRELEM